MGGHQEWQKLAPFRCRLLLANVPRDLDRNEELKARFDLWQRASWRELLDRIMGQQVKEADDPELAGTKPGEEERKKAARAKRLAAAGAVGKAIKGLRGGMAEGTRQEKETWAKELIPHIGGRRWSPANAVK